MSDLAAFRQRVRHRVPFWRLGLEEYGTPKGPYTQHERTAFLEALLSEITSLLAVIDRTAMSLSLRRPASLRSPLVTLLRFLQENRPVLTGADSDTSIGQRMARLLGQVEKTVSRG